MAVEIAGAAEAEEVAEAAEEDMMLAVAEEMASRLTIFGWIKETDPRPKNCLRV